MTPQSILLYAYAQPLQLQENSHVLKIHDYYVLTNYPDSRFCFPSYTANIYSKPSKSLYFHYIFYALQHILCFRKIVI